MSEALCIKTRRYMIPPPSDVDGTVGQELGADPAQATQLAAEARGLARDVLPQSGPKSELEASSSRLSAQTRLQRREEG